MSKNTVIFDANMILRYILEDNEKMADEVEEYIALYNVVITLEVVAEVVYVLRKVYCAERN
ncbi:MAG: PIN domain-containing protein, partial [Selenomonadaceae bacterium]|nr:PIN domain-containing protein [Selenomonadaceae bacterium]